MTDRDASLTRLNKFISETGFCSRREADRYIAEGRVTINGVVPEMGTKVAPGDEVLVNGKPLKAIPWARTLDRESVDDHHVRHWGL